MGRRRLIRVLHRPPRAGRAHRGHSDTVAVAEALEATAGGGRETTDEVCQLVVRTALPKYRVNDILRERGEKGAGNAHAAERNRDDAECDVQFVVRLLGDALAQDGN